MLLRIHEAHGSVLDWLQALLTHEIHDCGAPLSGASVGPVHCGAHRADRVGGVHVVHTRVPRVLSAPDTTGTLFRGNTVATKATDLYMKLIGLPYLHAVIGPAVRAVCEAKGGCEVDPTRLGPGDDFARNWQRLRQHTNTIWLSIAESISKMPMCEAWAGPAAAAACARARRSVSPVHAVGRRSAQCGMMVDTQGAAGRLWLYPTRGDGSVCRLGRGALHQRQWVFVSALFLSGGLVSQAL